MTLIFMIRYDYFTTIGTIEHNRWKEFDYVVVARLEAVLLHDGN